MQIMRSEYLSMCLLASRELQIKTTMYHYRSIRMAKIKTSTVPNAAKDVEKLDLSYVAGRNIK